MNRKMDGVRSLVFLFIQNYDLWMLNNRSSYLRLGSKRAKGRSVEKEAKEERRGEEKEEEFSLLLSSHRACLLRTGLFIKLHTLHDTLIKQKHMFRL